MMKKALQIIGCAAGGAMVGFFANRLQTVVGCVCFSLGVVLLAGAVFLVSKNDKENE